MSDEFRRRLLSSVYNASVHSSARASQSPGAQNTYAPRGRTSKLVWNLADHALGKDERGLVISGPVKLTADGGISGGGSIDADLMRFFLLFWDKFDWPDSRIIRIGGPDEHAQYLIEAGIISRSMSSGRISGNGSQIVLDCHLGAFKGLDQREPGKWSLAKGEGTISFPDTDLEEGRGLLFELHQAIPVPSREVPYQDILEFKQKRRDELLQLRYHLEDLFQLISGAPDIELARATEFERLDSAIADHIKAIREMNFPLRLAGLKANLNILPAIAGSLATVSASQSDLSMTNSFFTGVTAAVSVDVGAKLFGRAPQTTPYEYVGSIHKML